MVPRELPQLGPQTPVRVGLCGLVALGAAVLAGDPTSPPLRHAELFLQHQNSPSPLRRAHHFAQPISFQAVDLQLLVGCDPLQTGVLGLQLLEPLHIIGPHTAVLVAADETSAPTPQDAAPHPPPTNPRPTADQPS